MSLSKRRLNTVASMNEKIPLLGKKNKIIALSSKNEDNAIIREAMSIYEALTLMIAFAILIVALMNGKKK